MSEPAPLLVFSDDWGRHPSSCQHLVSHLLPERRVVWVNTIGTRPPRLDLATVRRGFEKLRQWSGIRRTRSVSDGVNDNPVANATGSPLVLNPKMWPSFRSHLGRALNKRLVGKAVRRALAGLPPPVVVTTLPVVADLVGAFPAARWVYYCVDEFGVWPGLDGRTLQKLEAELVPKVDVCVAVSQTLQRHLSKLGKESHLLTHGVDLARWTAPVPNDMPLSLAGVPELPRPLVVFWGVIDRRMDVAFVRAVCDSLADGTVLFVGPQDDPDPALFTLPRVRTLPPVPFADLPSLAAAASVLVMPYADLPVTRAMQPLKLKEYLATGKPTVVRSLPSTGAWADCMDVATTPEAFAGAVRERLRTGLPPEQREARRRLDAEGWAAKARLLEGWIGG